MAIFEHSFTGNYPVVKAQQMVFEALKEFFWGPFAQFNTPKRAPISDKNRPRPTNSPIVIHWELQRKSGDMIEIPVHRQLKQLPQTGKSQLAGHEERPKINFAQVPIMLQRHAELPQDSSMSTQVNKDLRLLENTRPALMQHYARCEEYLGASYAMYYGYSWGILNDSWFSAETKIAASSHPHIYVAGQGKVSYSGGYPGTAGYETAVAAAINAVGPSHRFDYGFLQALKADPQIRKIPMIIMNNNNPLRLLIAHPWQIVDLENDSTFNNIVAQAMVGKYAASNPYLIAAKYIAAGCAIYESDTAVWPVRVTSSLPDFGPATITDLDSFEDYSSDTKFAAIILGNNAIFKAIGSPMEYKRRTDDYGELVGIAYALIHGYSRGDFWNRDDGTTGQYLINNSSALAITYAAAPAY
jgi:hypothetical protein